MCIILRSGRSRGGARGAWSPPLFLDQNEAWRAEKICFGDRPPRYLRVWMTAPHPPPPWSPPLFFDQNEAWRAEKISFLDRPPPLYLRVWMTAPPPPYLKVGSATATQQNNFQNNCSAETNLLPPVQCCFLQTPKDQAFFRGHNDVASSGRGRKESEWLGCLEKNSLSVQFYQEFCPRL